MLSYSKSSNNWNIARLRYFNPMGLHESGLIGDDYATVDGTGVRDSIHVVDLALGHLKALDKLITNPGLVTYNLGTGQGYSVLEMVKAFELASGKTVAYQISPRREGDIAVCYAATNLAELELGWKAQRSISDMTADTWRWQANNPDGYN